MVIIDFILFARINDDCFAIIKIIIPITIIIIMIIINIIVIIISIILVLLIVILITSVVNVVIINRTTFVSRSDFPEKWVKSFEFD